jgi:hypothetical protein
MHLLIPKVYDFSSYWFTHILNLHRTPLKKVKYPARDSSFSKVFYTKLGNVFAKKRRTSLVLPKPFGKRKSVLFTAAKNF